LFLFGAGCQSKSTGGQADTSRKSWAPGVAPERFDFQALLGDPPADGSPEHRQEVDRMLSLQAQRTPDEVRRCKSEETVSVFAFSTVLGPTFNAKDLPFTARLMRDVYDEAKKDSDAAKQRWGRTRPPIAHPRIQPCDAF